MWNFLNAHKRGLIGTLVFHGVLVVVFLAAGFSKPDPPPAEKGIMINFGSTPDAVGDQELQTSLEQRATSEKAPSDQTTQQQQKQQKAQPAEQEPTSTESDQQVQTQDFEEAPSVESESQSQEKKQQQEPAREKPQQQKPEQEKKKQQETHPEREVNEKALYPGKSTQESGESEGETQGQGNQGRQTGSPVSDNHANADSRGMGGVNFTLKGRNPESLPKPEYQYQAEGKVVVEITVDQQGHVTKAEAGVKGSTTLNKTLRQAARKAALKAKFDPKPDAPAFQKGTITYSFKLN